MKKKKPVIVFNPEEYYMPAQAFIQGFALGIIIGSSAMFIFWLAVVKP